MVLFLTLLKNQIKQKLKKEMSKIVWITHQSLILIPEKVGTMDNIVNYLTALDTCMTITIRSTRSSVSLTICVLDELNQTVHHLANTVLDLVKLSVVHEGRRCDNLVLLVHANLLHIFEFHVGSEGLSRLD